MIELHEPHQHQEMISSALEGYTDPAQYWHTVYVYIQNSCLKNT